MQFELTSQFLDKLRTAIKEGQDTYIEESLHDLHEADIADIIENLDAPEAQYIYRSLEEEKAADVLVEMEEDKRDILLSYLTSKEIAEQVIDNIDTDDAADMIAELPESKKEEVISHIEDEQHAEEIRDLLAYDEDTAGGLMGKEMVIAHSDWNVTQAIREMRKQAEDVEQVYTIYVIDAEEKLLGRLSLKDILIAKSTDVIEELYKKDVRTVHVDSKAEEVAQIMKKYDLVAIPVVDEDEKLLGRITIDDVVDVIQEEAEKDYQMASGLSEKIEYTDSIWVLSRARLPWLLIGLFGGICGAMIIWNYEDQLSIHKEMAFFLPLIAAMGGNVGVQSSAIVVQGLANKTIMDESFTPRLWKEFRLAILNGLACCGIILFYNLIAGFSPLTIIVAIALFAVIIFAALFGTAVPLILDKLGIDPAMATGPFITTSNDIVGLFIYFLIGNIFFNLWP